MWQVYLRKLVKKRFEAMREKNRRVSLRGYSERLGLSPGSLSNWLNGNRSISLSLGKRVFEKIAKDEAERRAFRSLMRLSEDFENEKILEAEAERLIGSLQVAKEQPPLSEGAQAIGFQFELKLDPENLDLFEFEARRFAVRLNLLAKGLAGEVESCVSFGIFPEKSIVQPRKDPE